MAEKTFCDCCGNEIKKPRYTLSIFDSVRDDNELHHDLCTKCTRIVKQAIFSVFKD